jgi:hypothetical protein
MSLPRFPVLTYAPISFLIISIIDVSPQMRLSYSFRNVSSKNRVIVQVDIVSYES